MNRGPTILLGIAAALVMVFGAACLNYTYGPGYDHHAEWATAHGMPAPSRKIFVSGVASLSVGSLAAGFAVGRRKAAS